jgi:hypothetical protein
MGWDGTERVGEPHAAVIGYLRADWPRLDTVEASLHGTIYLHPSLLVGREKGKRTVHGRQVYLVV